MRQAQQNRRGRGRNNNNRGKSQNPLTRSYESNGPDVKIRGTPSHIAEKYVTMARDALSSGDPVLAENYLQHAEHYNRIIMTHREQQASQQGDNAQSGHNAISRHRNPGDPVDDDSASGDEDQSAVARGNEPQPSIESGDNPPNTRQSRSRSSNQRSGERDERPRRRSSSSDRGDRGDRDRPAGDAEATADSGRSSSRSSGRSSGARRERYAQSDDQPEFLKRPVRRTRAPRSAPETEEAPAPDEAAE